MYNEILKPDAVPTAVRRGENVFVYEGKLLKPIGNDLYTDKHQEILAQKLGDGSLAVFNTQITKNVFDHVEFKGSSDDIADVVEEILAAKPSNREEVYRAE